METAIFSSRSVALSLVAKQILFSQPPISSSRVERLGDFGDSVLLARRILNADICDAISRTSEQWSWVAADIRGRPLDDDKSVLSQKIGGELPEVECECIPTYDENVTNALWERLRPLIPPERVMAGSENSDYPSRWRPVGIDRVLRFVRFGSGSRSTVPHYDDGANCVDGNRRTLMSVLFSLTPQNFDEGHGRTGCNVRFLLDAQRWMPLDERDYSDHAKPTSPKDVLIEVPMAIGDCLLFDHNVLHDIVVKNDALDAPILLRTDVIYQPSASYAIEPIVPSLKSSNLSTAGPMAHLDRTYQKALAAFDGSFDAIRTAGYFDDGLQGDYNGFEANWWTCAVDKVQSRLSRYGCDASKKLTVLVTTGGFAPIHKGHIQMMETAKQELESHGIVVLGGYFCPDHDQYVSSKLLLDSGVSILPSVQRVYLCEQAVVDSDWLMVDRWAALYAPGSVNFTRILDHVSQMLAHNIRTHRPVNVVYVFGGDNARFSLSFVCRGSSMCVLREGSLRVFEEMSKYAMLRNSSQFMFSWNQTPAISSTNIRRGDASGLPEIVEAAWWRFQSARVGSLVLTNEPMNFYMRDEGIWAIEPWITNRSCDPRKTERAYSIFCMRLQQIFAKAFAREPRMLPRIDIVPLRLQDQQSVYQKRFGNQQVISLDPCLPGTVSLQISRSFRPLGNGECKFVPRYGAPSLAFQISKIERNNYILFDDDTVSGGTGKYVKALLADHCTIDRFETLCDARGPLDLTNELTPSRERLDHVDCRDFLVGSREGGLCLELLDASICRAPYVLPYVSPHDRASVPVASEKDFSADVWRLNQDFFSSLDVELHLEDMSPAFQELGDSLRFPSDMKMTDLCAWHLRHLQ
ncbi:hypothetical protein F4782DRAFT_34972 [Xylaria castorea]|nr:hypothetical protein F4782DRAFT_34972 [Xylaria castorea]